MSMQQIHDIESALIRDILELNILEQVDAEQIRRLPLTELGLDSLSAAHLREVIAESYGCEIPEALLGTQIVTLRQCAEIIARHVSGRPNAMVGSVEVSALESQR